MTNLTEYPTATPESVWAAFRESDRQRKENERILNEKFAETDRQIAETERLVQKISETTYIYENFADEYFFESFEAGKQDFFGEKFDRIFKNVKGLNDDFKDEYDIMLLNEKSVGIIDIISTAHENDVPKILRKAKTFRMNFPYYANHQVYLGVATMAFYPELEQECVNQGIAVIKQVGDSVVINYDNLKVF